MSERDNDSEAGLREDIASGSAGDKVSFSAPAAAPFEEAGEQTEQRKPVRSLMRRWRAIMLLAAGALVVSIALSMMHG